MDRRHRVYYLVNLNQNHEVGGWWGRGYDNYGIRYDRNMDLLVRDVPSLKVRPIAEANAVDDYYQMMISCRKRDEAELIETLDICTDVNYMKLEE